MLRDWAGIGRFHEQFGQSRLAAFLTKHWFLSVLVILIVTNLLLYAPALVSYFISDDFGTVAYLFFTHVLLKGQDLQWFLFQSNDGGLYFRPLSQLFYIVDSLMWGVEPFGYHLTNLIFHILTSLLVFLLAWRLSASRTVGLVAMALFAVMSVHSEAVAWIGARYDVICAFFYFSSVLFFVLYRHRGTPRFYLLSIAMFILALSSKEIAVTLPLVLLAYDLLYGSSKLHQPTSLVKRHLAFWSMLTVFIAARLIFYGRVGYGNAIDEGWVFYWLDRFLPKIVNPLAIDGESLRLPLAAMTVLVLMAYHSRREVMLGIAWIPLVYLATFNSGASDRSFYIPSFGLALGLAGIFVSPLKNWRNLSRVAGIIGIAILIAAYSLALFSRNLQFQFAGQVAETIPEQVKTNHPTLPEGARLYFVGVPDELQSGVLIYITGLTPSLQMTFRDPGLQALKINRFPILNDRLENVLFFEVDHRRVRERSDLVAMLKERNRCVSSSRPRIEWDFSTDAQGWEAWNDLTPLQVRDDLLIAQSLGNDPYIGSPFVNIPAIDMAEVAVTMRVRSNQPELKGAFFWLASRQDDFSPGLQETFPVQADGDFHTYRVDVGKSNKLFIEDSILRFRLDPVDAPAEIAIKSIAIYSRCADPQ